MTAPLDSDPQRTAADPRISAFVTANAGSGKTKTLIDRVARLLLEGVEPEKILCVTFTKAAAAEMQRRLFKRLGDWSVASDALLTIELADLEGRPAAQYGSKQLSGARALFARALETPGGLKIQTIHAFCEKLLRRFPLEAGISPGFRVMDDAASAAIAKAAWKAVARHALVGDGRLAQAYARLSIALDFDSFNKMFRTFEARRGALADFFEHIGGVEGADEWIATACGARPDEDEEQIADEAMRGLDRDFWRAAARVLSEGSARDQAVATAMAKVSADPSATLASALSALFTGKGEDTPIGWFGSAKVLKPHEGVVRGLEVEQERLDGIRDRIRGVRTAADTRDALTLADAYLNAYRIEKDWVGALDFTDLIEKTKALLQSRPAAAWVLYKLDGGIDHVLVDEAQDTAPDQWDIVRQLTGEFFVGDGAPRPPGAGGGLDRTLFVVGDEKQSIYSFQGADPARLKAETERYVAEIRAVGRPGESVPLLASWRSTVEVLKYVDAVFTGGVPPGVEPLRHEPKRLDHPGCVDIWPLFRSPPGETREAWDDPVDSRSEQSATRRLAKAIAAEIRDLVRRGDAVFDRTENGFRPAKWGDVLILVRSRGGIFEDVLRALKHESIPVAGADRLALSTHIVFDDLLAVARFVQFPDDDLTLAALLRSPFCDVCDKSLYDLAHNRTGSLWATLLSRADETVAWRGAADLWIAVLAAARRQRPFEFYSSLLGLRDPKGRSMRMRMLRRLGREAEDALETFVAQVMAAEARGVHDLETLVDDFAGLDIMVKRELEAERDEVRVMTAHGAKGLEAPIVFLPETTGGGGGRGTPLLETEEGGFLWSASSKVDCAAARVAREWRKQREDEESLRLLYVALTRARDRLVICGKIGARNKEENLKGWWSRVTAGFDHPEIAPGVWRTANDDMTPRRFGRAPERLAAAAAAAAPVLDVPPWARANPPAEAFARYASPSDLGEGAKAPAPSPLAAAGGLGRFRRGDLIHRLLQILPDLPVADRLAAARTLLGRERDLTEGQRAEMIQAALSVLDDARFSEVFGPGSRPEVAIAGSARALPSTLKISGRIDRLVVLPNRVLVADFKTNRPSPERIEDADPAYLRQMAIYAAVLTDIFPDRAIEAAIVWTDGPKLMPIPENLIAHTLAELALDR